MSSSLPAFGIYVHWPFCRSKCPYCDFNSHVADAIDAQAWQRAYIAALRHAAQHSSRLQVASIFFGGGTPSLMPPALVEAILDEVARLWPLAEDVEITLEANPTSAEQQNFAAFAAAGVNRLSLGVQALNDADLAMLGRQHTAEEARHAFELAQRLFPRASFDLIYARPHQTPAQWERELRQALSWVPEHLSTYQLTMEPETPFFALHEKGRLPLPDEEASLQMFAITRQMLADAGMPAYEVSNHARPGAQCRHNLLYWRYGCYAGIGPGAHGRLPLGQGGRRATVAIRHPQRWLAAVLAGQGGGWQEDVALKPRECAEECLLMGLRLREGLPLKRLQQVSGYIIAPQVLRALQEEGLLHMPHPDHITASQRGELVLEALIAELASALIPAHPADDDGAS